MKFDFSGQTTLITGGAHGIGRSLALGVARRGGRLVLIDLDDAALARLAAELDASGVRVFAQAMDLTQPDVIEALPAYLERDGFAPDCLINNAGRGSMGLFEELDASEFDAILQINFTAPARLIRSFLPGMLQRRSGYIVNVCSILGIIAAPAQSPYVASKFALRGLSEALAMELRGRGIGLSTVYPGGIATSIETRASIARRTDADLARQEMQRYAEGLRHSPDQAAETILQGVEKARRRILIGRDARAADRIQRLLPSAYADLLARRFGKPAAHGS